MTASPLKFLATIVACLLLASCAQTGPPLPPSLELPKPPSALRAVRKGDRVILTWSEPTRTTDRQTVRYLGPTLICRSLKAEISACENPVGQVPTPARVVQPTATTQPSQQTFTDLLPATIQAQNPTGEITYTVEVLNRDQRTAGPSNLVAVAAVPVLLPPADFRAELTGNGVGFTWTSAGESAAPLGTQLRYRIYRRDEATGKDVIVSESPVGESGPMRAQDSSFEWEKAYLYRVTAVSIVSRQATEIQVEGDDSPTVGITTHDVFPPAVPSGLQAVYSGEGQKAFVDLIWAPVTDADLSGYNVYRRDGDSASVKLNSEPIKSPSYRDSAVASGRTYTYSVSATDVRGNESASSEDASESVP